MQAPIAQRFKARSQERLTRALESATAEYKQVPLCWFAAGPAVVCPPAIVRLAEQEVALVRVA